LTDLADARQQRRFQELIAPHLDAALSLARWLTRDPADAEDVVQEACLRAFNAIDQCTGENPRGWLLTIVRNAAFTWLARNRPKQVIAIDTLDTPEDGEVLADPQATPEAALIEKADAAMLREAVGRLPLAFREALVLREFQELSYREIAEIAHVPIGTVMSRLARARALLIADIGRLIRPLEVSP
jgi:RNA polymerase sigma factor (sigma-70 family)